jgi:hypothetical protein
MNNYFTKVYDEVIEDAKFIKMKLSSQLLFIYLLKESRKYANKDGWFFKNMDTIVKDTGISHFTITSAKQELLEKGFISIKRTFYPDGHRKADNYKITKN